MHSQLVVLGGGPGGYAAAFAAADLGMEVTIVEREPRLGGVCLLRGCIPSKALLHVAKAIRESHELAGWGVQFDGMHIDIDTMRGGKTKVIERLTGGLKQLAKQRSVRHVQAEGKLVSSTSLSLSGGNPESYAGEDHITFDHLIVATGSTPVMPGLFRIDNERVMSSDGALDLPEIPEKMLVVGGGYIGLEMGTVYAALGTQVSVVEMVDRLLPGIDRDLVKPLSKRFNEIFTDIHLKTEVTALIDHGEQIEVIYDGEKVGSERFDRVLVAVGRRPSTANLGLENTQVQVNERGFIVADSHMRTSDPHILAIGDVVGDPMLAHKAAHEGKIAAEVLAGEPAEFDKRAIPAVIFTDPEIAWAGLTEEDAKRQQIAHEVAQFPWAASGRANAVHATAGLTKLIIEPETNRILGAGIVGSGAGELIAETVLAIEMGCTARDLAESIHPHPTLSETVGFAGDVQLGTATEIYRPKASKRA
ncbi:MAG: dihydrolipoyl dehydrogenase [Planctomycetota bacterium]|nr:MAG: dihydrolipoyl dehydrogenase [Planctomycetota bacterium]REJ89227.1 MAG: dihydrolipoyl dehydrogenase [Planctomycetota bacterium]REK31611.1 MAG: dihydrolipoyl dehydrogenase [Planctomycetota bacterium]REK38405.1 MAG: dihydrolipoyl dehydrogenase [Planctomycetota bacterium]